MQDQKIPRLVRVRQGRQILSRRQRLAPHQIIESRLFLRLTQREAHGVHHPAQHAGKVSILLELFAHRLRQFVAQSGGNGA